MINTFIYHAVPSTTKNAYKAYHLGELIARVNMPITFEVEKLIKFDGKFYRVLSKYFSIDDDAFIITVYPDDFKIQP